MNYQDYYKTLGVSKSATDKEIKQAYRKLARQYHPDKNPNDAAAEEKFKAINEAYEVLGNADNRAKFDRLGGAYHQYQQMGGNPGGFDFSQFFDGNGRAQGGDFSDFFSAIFGNAQARSAARRQPNLNIEHNVTVTLEEAYEGSERVVNIGNDRFTAKIPAGVKDGTKIRLRGKGRKANGRSGDLFLKVALAPHDTFTVDGDNLRTQVEIEDVTAVLGGKTAVPTLTGSVTLSIPAGTQPGQTIRLKGKGMPKRNPKGSYGDLLATIKVTIPKTLDDEARALYERLAQLRESSTHPIKE